MSDQPQTTDGDGAGEEMTLEQARERIDQLNAEIQSLRDSGQMLSEFFLHDILEVNMPIDVVRTIARLMRQYLVERGHAPADGGVWVTTKRNRFGVGPGDLTGESDPDLVARAWKHFASDIMPARLVAGDGRSYTVLPLFTSFDTAGVFGLLGVELLPDTEIPVDTAAVALSIALSVTLQLERTHRIAEAQRGALYAQVAARAQMLLGGPRERDEALRIVVETLETCSDISGAVAVTTVAEPPKVLASWGDVDPDQAISLALGETLHEKLDGGFHILPIDIEDAVEAAIVLRTRSSLDELENEMLATIARAVAGAVARYRAGLTIESLRRSATRRLVEAQERERTMVAADIHDGVLQQLGATAIRLELAQARVEHGDFATARTIIEDGAKEIRSCARDLRDLLMELRPQVLDDNGLTAALKELGRHVKHVEVSVHSEVPDDLGNEYSITIFRIVQEALTNIQKHAQANNAEVKVMLEGETIDIEIRDDGIGYEAAVTGPSSEGSHLGLLGMRERARMLGGRFSIEGGPGRGTLIRAILPLAPSDARQNGAGASADDAAPVI